MGSKTFLALAAGLFLTLPLEAQETLTVVHPAENVSLPPLRQVFVYGAVTPGSTLILNGSTVPVHPQGGYLVMVPVKPGPVTLHAEARTPKGEVAKLDRHFTVGEETIPLPVHPLAIQKQSIEPNEDIWLAPGDALRVAFQGSPEARAEFSIDGVRRHIPMRDRAAEFSVGVASETVRGLYEGLYVIQPGDRADGETISVTLKRGETVVQRQAQGHLRIDAGAIPRTGVITEDVVAVRTGADGGYDLFLYKGMRVRLTGKIGREWRVRLASNQTGWVKENAIQELPRGTLLPQSTLSNIKVVHQDDSTLIRIPLTAVLPYRVEQSLDPTQLTLTVYGAVDRTDFIRYDPQDALIHLIRWKQVAPDACQVIIQPAFKTWWGFDVRYEGTTLIVEVRKPWPSGSLSGMPIAIDAGHGGSELGAIGPHGTLEKDANLAIAKVVRDALESAGAKPFLIREKDITIPLYDRSRFAWNHNARLFVSVHCNASGEGENPVLNNGFSVYWYQPQSLGLARGLHAAYEKKVPVPDHGLFYADFAVCRMTQMPAVLTEQAYMIVPEHELLIFHPDFQKKCAQAILHGIRQFLKDAHSVVTPH